MNSPNREPTDQQRIALTKAIAEERVCMPANIAAAREAKPRLLAEAQFRVDVVRRLREAREAVGVSLSELESRTGIQKSALSRLENSKAPNPTLATLRRYADAIGMQIDFSIAEKSE